MYVYLTNWKTHEVFYLIAYLIHDVVSYLGNLDAIFYDYM